MKKNIFFIICLCLIASGFLDKPVLAYVMESTNFRLQQDSINFGGGLGTSTDYRLEDTLGEIGTGYSSSSNFNLHAGYHQMDQNTYITISSPDAVSMLPAIPGLSGGTATGSAGVAVMTNNNLGYSLYIRASTTPAMQSTSSNFANYTPAGADPDFLWSVAPAGSAFGFSPEGGDIITRYKDDGAVCNVAGGDNSNRCWDAIGSVNGLISQSNIFNAPNNTTTTIKFQAESGSQHSQQTGHYSAIIIMTGAVN
jgi:hypothetical protein